jgi:hypothetical protein
MHTKSNFVYIYQPEARVKPIRSLELLWIFSIYKSDGYDIADKLLKVTINTHPTFHTFVFNSEYKMCSDKFLRSYNFQGQVSYSYTKNNQSGDYL